MGIISNVRQTAKASTWKLPKQTTTFAEEGDWSNVDSDVTPLDRQTWTALDIAGYWFSDALNAQGWEGPSSIIEMGLTWKEALYTSEYFATPLISGPS